MRNISFMLTTGQCRRKEKDVTRRLGWEKLKPGDLLQQVVKSQGLKKGEKIEKLSVIEVVNVRREPLNCLLFYPPSAREVEREGFPGVSAKEFMAFFCASHKGCAPETIVTRIEGPAHETEKIVR